MKKHFRCFVCNDIHYGFKPPEICPTCMAKNAYVEISSEEAIKIMRQNRTSMDRENFRESIESLTEKNEFQVNPDKEKVNMLIEGIHNNEKNHGLKYCPCRMITKDFNEDLKLVCPCNFLIHETYKDKKEGECWCGLFIRRR
jgi:ferredoxin-thioredoxin reductase catalytic subunit